MWCVEGALQNSTASGGVHMPGLPHRGSKLKFEVQEGTQSLVCRPRPSATRVDLQSSIEHAQQEI